MGSETEIPIDVRVISATNQPIKEMMERYRLNKDGEKFRPDLYYRLNQISFNLLPLRERLEDIPFLARYFIKSFSNSISPDRQVKLSANATAALMNQPWLGNARDLKHVMERASLRLRGRNILAAEDLSFEEETSETNNVQAKLIQDYVGIDKNDENGCRGWALFSPSTYDIDPEPNEDWTHCTLAAFRQLKNKGIDVNKYCSIGCGAALDAVIAVNIWGCPHITLSDINESVLPLARENVYLNCRDAVEVDTTYGSLFLNFSNERFDLIFENLPNLPWHKEGNLEGRKWATFYDYDGDKASATRQWLLSSHEHFLEQAKSFLEPNGLVVCCIGARVPWRVVVELFEAQGYAADLLYYGLKKQQQVEEVVEGYATAERGGLGPFRFFDLDLARKILGEFNDADSPDSMLEAIEGDRLKQANLTASAALQANRDGRTIGHGVYVVAGKLKK